MMSAPIPVSTNTIIVYFTLSHFLFVLFPEQAFTDKSYPVESNQAKWISMIVDFFVDSIISTVS